jgi:hypothetical protein
MVTVTVICESLTTTRLLAVTPVPEKVTAVAPVKPVPTITTPFCTEPGAPVFGKIDVTVGVAAITGAAKGITSAVIKEIIAKIVKNFLIITALLLFRTKQKIPTPSF